LDPEIENESEEKRIQLTQNQKHLEGPRSWTKPRSKTRDLSPWYCRGSTTIAADQRKVVGSRVDLQRVASSRLSKHSFTYKYCIFRPKTRLESYRLGFSLI